MAINILDMLKSQLGGQLAGQLGRQFGESEGAAKSGIDALIPTILGGLLKQVAAPGGAEKLDKTMKDGGYDGGLLDGLSGMLTGGSTDALSGKGNEVVTSLFGDKVALLLPILSKVTGLKLDSLKSLLAIVAPLILSFLGKQQKALGLDANGLASMLMSQKDSIGAALPPGISDAMGLGSLGVASPAVARPAVTQPSSSGGAMKVLIPLAILAAVGYGCYRYIFAGIRPSGAAGNVVLALPEGTPTPEQFAASAGSTSTSTSPMAEEPVGEPQGDAPSEDAPGLGLPDLSKLPGLEGVPDLKSLFGSMSETLSKVKDVDTAKAAVPELEAMDKQLEGVSSGFNALPEAVRSKLTESVTGMLPDIQATIDKVLAIPGVGEVLKPIIDQVMAKIATLKGQA